MESDDDISHSISSAIQKMVNPQLSTLDMQAFHSTISLISKSIYVYVHVWKTLLNPVLRLCVTGLSPSYGPLPTETWQLHWRGVASAACASCASEWQETWGESGNRITTRLDIYHYHKFVIPTRAPEEAGYLERINECSRIISKESHFYLFGEGYLKPGRDPWLRGTLRAFEPGGFSSLVLKLEHSAQVGSNFRHSFLERAPFSTAPTAHNPLKNKHVSKSSHSRPKTHDLNLVSEDQFI